MPLAHLFIAAVPLAWLVPNHDLPWVAAWPEALAILLLLSGALMLPRTRSVAQRLPLSWALVLAVALASLAVQAAAGLIHFRGDVLMTAMYAAVLALAIAAGTSLWRATGEEGFDGADALAIGLLAVAMMSVAIALMQWTGVRSIPLAVVDIRPGARPYANVAQANHFVSLLFLGLCALLLLHARGRVGRSGVVVGGLFLVWGMVMSGSRTGWLQIALLAGAFAFARWRGVDPGLSTGRLALLVGAFVLMTATWPSLNAALLLAGGRDEVLHFEGGGRLEVWRMLIDAIGRRPGLGHGWQQGGAALLAVAGDHPPIGRMFDRAHNFVLETLVATGVPFGLALIGLIAHAFVQQAKAVTSARSFWPLVAAAGLLVHAMVEYPLEYAYFLIPFGLMLGMAHAADPSPRSWPVPAVAWRALAAGGLLVLGLVARDYFESEQNFRTFRLESARIGTTRIESAPPDLLLLDQLQALLTFARTEARPGLDARQLQWMRQVAERYPMPPVLFRLSIAEGLNGRPEEAARMLLALCRIHPRVRCDEARQMWPGLQAAHPPLLQVQVPAP